MSSSNSSLSMVESRLPPGFRFHPRDEELVCDYLMNKVFSCSSSHHHDHDHPPPPAPPLLIEVDLNKCEPWDIPPMACVGGKQWYFYNQRDKKYATGLRTNRATISGYWKATGKDRPVLRKGTLVGMRKTLVFYQGRAPKGRKTDWVMHEFRLEGSNGPPNLSSLKEDWVLCRMFHKNKEIIPVKQPIIGCGGGSGGGYGGDHTTKSSSLPPLMEQPYITFDQTQTSLDYQQYQQVPCFSIFTPNQTNPSPNVSQINHMQPNLYSAAGNYNDIGTHSSISSESCDENVLKAVLNHITKMETNTAMKEYSSSFGEGSSESFLSEVGLATMWNQC